MFDGRHCTQKDLDLLVKETKNVKKYLQNSDKINSFLDFVARFDRDIADKMRRQITSFPNDVERIIDSNISSLIQNVTVDIYEHQ